MSRPARASGAEDASARPGPDTEAASAAPDVSLVIVVYKTPDLLLRCLDSIERARMAPSFEVIIIDNAPGEGECGKVAEGRPCVRYVPNARNVGFGRAVNQGLRLARGRAFLVLNPDIEVLPGSVEALLRCLEQEPDCGIAAPRLHYGDGTLQESCRTFYTLPTFLLRRTFLGRLFPESAIIRRHLMRDFDHETTRNVDWCLGAALMVRREAVADVGMMDERFFMYFEDVDWCNRMHARGWKVLYHPESRMIHHYQRASAGFWPKRGLFIHLGSVVLYYEKWSFLLYWLKLRSHRLRQAALFLTDLVMVSLAFLLAYALRSLAGGVLTKPLFAFELYHRFFAFTLVVAMGSFVAFGLYRERMRPSLVENGLPVARALGWTSMLMMAATFLFSVRMYSRFMVFLFLPLSVLLVTFGRTGLLRMVDSVRRRDLNLRRVGLLGPAEAVAELMDRFARFGRFGMEPVPLVLLEGARETDWVRRVRTERVAELILFEDWEGDVRSLMEELDRRRIPVRLIPTLRSVAPVGARYAEFLGWPSLLVGGPGGGILRSPGRRLGDLAAWAVFGLVFLLPFLLAAAARGAFRRPVFERVGLHGPDGEISVLRFRGTRVRSGFASTVLHCYPALSHVAAGRISLTGIFPFTEAEWHSLSDEERRRIPALPPALLGPWTGGRMRSGTEAAWSRAYAARWSPAEDFRIFWRALLSLREPAEGGTDASEGAPAAQSRR